MSSYFPSTLPTQRSAKPRWSALGAVRYTLIALGTVTFIHLTLFWLAPDHPYTTTIRTVVTDATRSPDLAAAHDEYVVEALHVSNSGSQGGFRRDSRPIRTILSFWDIAEKEVAARGLDTCESQLGRAFIEAYHETELPYCSPLGNGRDRDSAAAARNASAAWPSNDSAMSPTYMTCSAIKRHRFTQWWPYPAAPCLSSNLRVAQSGSKAFHAVGCEVTEDGSKLLEEMGHEDFAGRHTDHIDLGSEETVCREVIGHTTLLIGRQDQWNP